MTPRRFSIRPVARRPALSLIALALSGLLAACGRPGGVAPGAAAPRPVAMAAESGDSCGPQVVVFVNAGDLFGAPPRRLHPPTADELARELAQENAAIDRLQVAFDALLYCRWTEVRLVRAEANAGRLPQATARTRIAEVTDRLRSDVGRAGQIRTQIAARTARLDAALEGAQPGMGAEVARVRAAQGKGLPAVATGPVLLRAQPDGGSAEVGRLPANEQVRLATAPHGFAAVEAGGLRGFARADAFTRIVPPADGGAEDLRTLAATNVARREAFQESLALAQRSAETGFELAL
jgi:hypothetical protein